MKFKAMLRIKNEARWIERVLRSLQPLCEQIHVLDDHSTDDTVAICESMDKVIVHPSPFEGIREVRDKNYLLEKIVLSGPSDWIIHVDGDEELEANGPAKLRQVCEQWHDSAVSSIALQVMYLWDSEDQIRVDGLYETFLRPSVFRAPDKPISFASQHFNTSELHCSNAPAMYLSRMLTSNIHLWHYGYIDAALRIQKYEFYNRIDPNNELENFYNHTVIGDVFPTDSKFKHAGPLRLVPRPQ